MKTFHQIRKDYMLLRALTELNLKEDQMKKTKTRNIQQTTFMEIKIFRLYQMLKNSNFRVRSTVSINQQLSKFQTYKIICHSIAFSQELTGVTMKSILFQDHFKCSSTIIFQRSSSAFHRLSSPLTVIMILFSFHSQASTSTRSSSVSQT